MTFHGVSTNFGINLVRAAVRCDGDENQAVRLPEGRASRASSTHIETSRSSPSTGGFVNVDFRFG
jgi:hypothetical protein